MAHHFRLGFPVRVQGAPIRSHDSRRYQNGPHLSVSLAYLRDILEYCRSHAIHFYRMAGQLAPYLTHPALPDFHRQLDECSTELAAAGDLARSYGIRLTLHPGYYIRLSSPDAGQVQRSLRELAAATALLDAMGLGTESIVVIHVGGGYGDLAAAGERFVRHFEQLPGRVRRRVALENDDRLFTLEQLWWIHRRTGVPLVLDTLHHQCNPDGRSLPEALALALGSWPSDIMPKIHFSSPRTALRAEVRRGAVHLRWPVLNQHAELADPFAVIDLLGRAYQTDLRPFDVMLEVKAGDLALLRLREQVARLAPGLGAVMG
jgi:UV DNA damage endonuclease